MVNYILEYIIMFVLHLVLGLGKKEIEKPKPPTEKISNPPGDILKDFNKHLGKYKNCIDQLCKKWFTVIINA